MAEVTPGVSSSPGRQKKQTIPAKMQVQQLFGVQYLAEGHLLSTRSVRDPEGSGSFSGDWSN